MPSLSSIDLRFQSAPGAEAGGKLLPAVFKASMYLFQSAPGAEAGGKTHLARRGVLLVLVSIRPRR